MPDAPTTTSMVFESLPWLRLAPPVVAVVFSIILREVNFSLLLATFAGSLLLANFDVLLAVNSVTDVLANQIANFEHAQVILFTVLLGAMISLMSDSGGTNAVVDGMARFANTRRKGQILTWIAGLVVFFDDYANTMLIGGSMRPLSDRLRISRAKLAFLIDATAAPVAGLAISTWTAFEIGQVTEGLSVASVDANAGEVFLATIPFRIYPLLAIVAVGAVAVSGRDFGPMLKAERQACEDSGSQKAGTTTIATGGSIWFAIVPVAVLVTVVLVGFKFDVDAYRLLLIASLAACVPAVLMPLFARRMTADECSQSLVRGIGSMMPAVTILVLAWSISAVCNADNLNTAQFIVSLVGDSIRPEFLPTVSFIVAGAVAFSIGSSFTTMGLLIPMFIPLSWSILATATDSVSVDDPVFLATIGAILAGAIFGDHCSPISDTTVLSSAAAGCDHLQHVATQLPYAIVVAVCSILFGYLPIGFGVPWWIALPVSTIACVGIILLLGQNPSQSRRQMAAEETN